MSGLTIANNLIQGGGNGVNDSWIDHTEVASSSTPGARNVLIDGNTFQQQHRCNIDATVKAIGWAVVNNVLTYTDGYVAPVDLEPYATNWGPNTITNHESKLLFLASFFSSSAISPTIGSSLVT